MDCHVVKPLPEFAQLANVRLLESSNIVDYSVGNCSVQPNGVYPDDGLDPSYGETDKKDLVWGDDILFLDQRPPPIRQRSGVVSAHISRRTVEEEEEETKMALIHGEATETVATTSKIELSGHMVTMCDLSEMGSLMSEPDKYMSSMTLPGYGFLPKDEVVEVEELDVSHDLDNICNSLQLGSMGQNLDQNISPSPETDPPPHSGRPGLRRTRNASRRLSTVDDAASSYGEGNGRRRNSSEHSVMSNGSCYDDPDSPYNNHSGKRKRRRYEEDPSDDPAFEKSRKNAIIAKRNREKKKMMMEQMETKCEHLTARNHQLDTDNGKLRHRVQTLEEEVLYLKSVLANQSALAQVLSTLDVNKAGGTSDPLRYSTSFEASKYKKPSSSSSQPVASGSGGICLHVDGNQVSMEMCAKCAQMARGAPRSAETSGQHKMTGTTYKRST